MGIELTPVETPFQVQEHLTDNPKLQDFIDNPGAVHAPYQALHDNGHIEDMDKSEGTFQPFQEFLQDKEQQNAWAKTSTKIINDAWMAGHPKVREAIHDFEYRRMDKTYTQDAGGRALLESYLSKRHISDSTLWNIYGQSFARALGEEIFNSKASDEDKKQSKDWRTFDGLMDNPLPIQELLTEIHKGWNKDEVPLRKKK